MGIDPGKETEPFAYWIFRCRGRDRMEGEGLRIFLRIHRLRPRPVCK